MTDGQAFDRERFRSGYSDTAEGPHWETFDPGEPPTLGTEATLTAGFAIEPGRPYGFFTDTTLCIGCKACEVACKAWNNLPADDIGLTTTSYDQTRGLGHATWRHVKFVEQAPARAEREAPRWLFLSDICKHCANAPCMEACPTGAIVRTEYDSVLIQQDICNGCKYCVPACPWGVITIFKEGDGTAHKCTFCYDRLQDGLEPACAKSCPTDSIQFGPVDELVPRAEARLAALHRQGFGEARLYGAPGTAGATGGLDRLNSFSLLMDEPNVYGLPTAPRLPARSIIPGALASVVTAAALIGVTALALFTSGRRD